MIYLFDDKRGRQESYGWTDYEFNLWEGKLILVRDYSEFLLQNTEEMFSDGNIILYHESFPTCVPYSERQSFQSFHDFIVGGEYSSDIKIAIFSGSIKNRDISGNIAFLPVTNLYANLGCFLNHYHKCDFDFKYLLWGDDYKVEQELAELIDDFDNEDTEDDIEGDWNNVFFAKAQKYGIDAPSDDCVQETLWLGKVTDEDFGNYIEQWFTKVEYDAIYIPLCFGRTLSDYNGLRLAIHIRCSQSLNDTKPICIYSPVNEGYLLKSPYFDILKTKGVKLVKMDKKHLVASFGDMRCLSTKEVSHEMKKVSLPIPQNYEDTHSIANEWAIYRWAAATDSDDSAIEKVNEIVKSNLYFKHLCTIYSPSEIGLMSKERLKFKSKLSEKSNELIENINPKILYVDDEADKGWYEILANIIYDINEISFDYLGEDLRSFSREKLIDFVVEKVINTGINILILDFRLHKEDHNTQDIEDITSVQILKRIKAYNPGIQIVIFSATNKVWNLLALQKYGADGFIIKENIDNSKDSTFTVHTIENFVSIMSDTISNIYKKHLFECTSQLIDQMEHGAKHYILDKNFVLTTKLFFDIAYQSLPTSVAEAGFDHSFLNYYRILEAISNEIIASEPILVDDIENNKRMYKWMFRPTYDYLKDYDKSNPSYSDKILVLPMTHIPHDQKFYNMFAYLGVSWPSTYDMVNKRHNITHANSRVNGKVEAIKIEDVLLAADICIKCIYNLMQIKKVK